MGIRLHKPPPPEPLAPQSEIDAALDPHMTPHPGSSKCGLYLELPIAEPTDDAPAGDE